MSETKRALPTDDEIDNAVCSAIYDASWSELASVICRIRDASQPPPPNAKANASQHYDDCGSPGEPCRCRTPPRQRRSP